MYQFIVGIDVSKSKIDVAYFDRQSPIYLGEFKNSVTGFKAMLEKLKQCTSINFRYWFVCFENTGSYSKLLLEWLSSQQIDRREESALRIKKSLGIKRGKSDKIDAMDICEYAYEKKHKLNPTMLDAPTIIKLRKLLNYRKILVSKRQSLMICLKDELKQLDKDIADFLEQANKEIIDLLSEKIKKTEQAIEDLIHAEEEIKTNYKLIRSVVGVGLVTGVYVICMTNNFKRITTPKKLCCSAAIAPHPNESGTKSRNKRVTKIGDRTLKSLLSNAANVAVQYDHELKAYYQRKLEEGKIYPTVINAVKNKLIHRIFAVIKRQTPYVNLKQYA